MQNLVPLTQIPTAMAIVIFAQNMGAATWVVVANAIFNNSLREQLMERAATIGLSANDIINAGARSTRSLGLSSTQLAAVLDAYSKAVDNAMYLGIAVSGAGLIFVWGLGFKNVHKVKDLTELSNENDNKKSASTPGKKSIHEEEV